MTTDDLIENKKKEEGQAKETSAYGSIAKLKEESEKDGVKIEDKINVFYGASTVPDRVCGVTKDGDKIEGEILSKKVLDKFAAFMNNDSVLGGKIGSYRTISLFHDRVHLNNPQLEPAGFVVPGSAKVVPHEKFPGQYALEVSTKTNKYFKGSPVAPDYNSEKIQYMIDNDALGLSIEYNNEPHQEKIIDLEGKKYRYIIDSDDFRGFGYARANVIGNATAVSIKEIQDIVENKLNETGEGQMDESKLKELQSSYETSQEKVKELSAQIETLRNSGDSKMKEMETKMKELESKAGDMSKMKEALAEGFKSLNLQHGAPINSSDKMNAKTKEFVAAIDAGVSKRDWKSFVEVCDAKIKEQGEVIMKKLKNEGIRFEDEQTLKVKCMGSAFHHDGRMVVESSAKTKELLAKTKDTIDANDMNEATYYQTNAFFADRYVPGITETFLKADTLLTAMNKEQFAGGNDKYQWRIWVDFATFTGANTKAVDPNITSVSTSQYNFLKLETPIREYREAIEVTDFTQFHSASAVGDLMGQEIQRAAEVVTNSMNADLYKGYNDASAGWLGVNGLLAVADSATYTSIYGRVRSAANRLLDATTANTYDTTGGAVTTPMIRAAYTKVRHQGSMISSLAIVTSPTQMRRIFDLKDDTRPGTANYNVVVMNSPSPNFGFSQMLIPYIDGVPVIVDEYCVDASGNQDTLVVVDMSPDKGFNLIVSKPLGVRGLAKVGTSEKSYVSFWGTTVYKAPRNIHLLDDLTTT